MQVTQSRRCDIMAAGGMELVTEKKRTLLERFPVRKTYAQKSAFIEYAKTVAREKGIGVTVEEGGKRIRSRNIVFGNPARARVLITAHYDTCAGLPFPNLMTPDNWPVIIATEGLLFAALILLGIWGGRGIRLLLRMAACPGWLALAAGFLAGTGISLGLLALMLVGPANKSNANDNTSGVLFVLSAMERFAQRQDVAYVLFDNEEKGLLGASAFIAAHPQIARRALIVNMDCIGDGDTLLYTGTKRAMMHPLARRIADALKEAAPRHGFKPVCGEFPKWLYPSDQMLFPRGTAFAALKGKRILYLDRIHTKKDTVLEEANIRCLLNVLEQSL